MYDESLYLFVVVGTLLPVGGRCLCLDFRDVLGLGAWAYPGPTRRNPHPTFGDRDDLELGRRHTPTPLKRSLRVYWEGSSPGVGRRLRVSSLSDHCLSERGSGFDGVAT